MRRPAIAFLLLLSMQAIASGAHAATVQKCRRVDGTVAYQSAACGPGEHRLGTWAATPEVLEAEPREPRARREPGPPRRMARVRTDRAAIASVDACAAAKARRDEIERRVGLARTYELLSRLQREVFDACR